MLRWGIVAVRVVLSPLGPWLEEAGTPSRTPDRRRGEARLGSGVTLGRSYAYDRGGRGIDLAVRIAETGYVAADGTDTRYMWAAAETIRIAVD